LPIVLAAVARDAGAAPGQVLADAGYPSEATFEQNEPELDIPAEITRREGTGCSNSVCRASS
jgi:hypothetical protein